MNSKGDQLYMAQNGIWTMQPNTSCTVASSAGGNYTTGDGVFPGINGRILYGFSTSGGWYPFQFSTGQSGLYPGAGCFTTALSGTAKYNKYTGSLTNATQTEWLSRIGDASNWTNYGTSVEYFAAKPDFSSLIMSIDPNGVVPSPTWSSPKSLLCSNAGNIDFTNLITGTTGGTWSGTGISPNGIFNASGLSGNYNITYTVNYNTLTDTCALTHTDTVNVGNGFTPTFAAIAPLWQNSIAPILPTSSTNIPPISGTWNAPISTKVKGITDYTFTPTAGKCNGIATMGVQVIDSALTTPSTCLGTTLYLTGVSGAKQIAWYKNGNLDTTYHQTRASVAVTVAGGNKAGAANNQLNVPYGVAVDNNRDVYVTDYNNDRIMYWPKGATTGTLFAGVTGVSSQNPNHFYNPTGLFLSSTGSLYISDYGNHKVQKYLAGSSTSTIVGGNESSVTGGVDGPSNLAYPLGIFVDADSNLYSTDASNIPTPCILSSSPNSGNRVMEWAPGASSGTLVAGNAAGAGTGLGYLTYPSGVYVNKAGDIYVADFANFRVVKWAPGATTGVVVADLSKSGTGGTGLGPTDVWVDENTDSLYITASNDIVNLKVLFCYNSKDNFLFSWKEGAASGTVINTGTSSANTLYSPYSLTIGNDGSIYVADAGNNRVQAWLTSIDTTLTPTTVGSYYAVITNFNGTVDTSNTIIIAQPTSSTTLDSICAGSSYMFNGNTYSTPGTYVANLTNSGGCDSTATLKLSLKNTTSSTTNITVCPQQLPYDWNGIIFTAAGSQTANLTNSVGCDSAATLVLTVSSNLSSTSYDTICPSELPYTWNGLTFTAAGSQTANLKNAYGCDSAATLMLTVKATSSSTTKDSICPSQLPFTWNGLTFTTTGTETAHLKNSVGCDSAATLVLTLKAAVTSTSYDSICPSQLPFIWNGLTFTAAGTQTAKLTTAGGCDSLATLVLTLKATVTSTTYDSICPNQLPFIWNGLTFNAAGTQTAKLTSKGGCDSAATLVLTLKATVSSTTYDSICPNQLPFIWNGLTFNTAGTQTAKLASAGGCDSLATLVLTLKATVISATYDSICPNQFPLTWNGLTFTAAGTQTATLTSVGGCDSLATLVLSVKKHSNSTSYDTICSNQLPFTWNGLTFNAAGTQTANLTSSSGCDSAATLVLTVKATTSSTTYDSICPNQLPFTWNGLTFNAAGTQTAQFTNSVGCDSAASLVLFVKATTSSTTNDSICANQLPFIWNGLTLNSAGTQTVHFTNSAGCDSAATLVLTVKATTSSTTNVSVCTNQLPYTWNGLTLNSAGTQTVHLANSAGCDSAATLVLAVKAASSSTTNTSICSTQLPYTWNGLTFNAAGSQTANLINSVGCDSAATLVLTVNASTSSTTHKNICTNQLPYVWNGLTFSSTGPGCDSAATLVLTVNSPTSSTIRDTICKGGTFTFNNNTYDSAGTYTLNLTNSVGCDSLVTLVLSIDSMHIPYPPTGPTAVCINDTITLTDLISGGTWSSTNPNIDSVSTEGVVTGLNFGSDSIKYTVELPCGIASSYDPIQVLGVKPDSKAIPKNATCLNPQSGSIKVSVDGSEGPYQISYDGTIYDTSYTIPNLGVGNYDIYIYNSAGCPVDSLNNVPIILFDDGSCDTLFVPSGFVPTSNNSGNTKLLKPYAGSTSVQYITFRVYNRYGGIVFESHDISSGWDGTVNGVPQDIGTYIWFLDYTQANGIKRHSQGTSVLIR
jgi:G:T/U-mismatch repair DNA glycosylase